MYVKERSLVMKRMIFCVGIILASAIAFGTVPENFESNFREGEKIPLKTVRRSHSLSEVSNLYETNNYLETINPFDLSELMVCCLVSQLDKENAKLQDEVVRLEKKLKQTHIKDDPQTLTQSKDLLLPDLSMIDDSLVNVSLLKEATDSEFLPFSIR